MGMWRPLTGGPGQGTGVRGGAGGAMSWEGQGPGQEGQDIWTVSSTPPAIQLVRLIRCVGLGFRLGLTSKISILGHLEYPQLQTFVSEDYFNYVIFLLR